MYFEIDFSRTNFDPRFIKLNISLEDVKKKFNTFFFSPLEIWLSLVGINSCLVVKTYNAILKDILFSPNIF